MSGENLSFDDWYRATYPRVLIAVAIVCGGEHARAEDATNDAFVKAYERWSAVAAMGSPAGWVTQVAINGAKRGFRRRARGFELLNTQRLELAVVDSYIDVDVWDSLKGLTFRQREAIVLRYIDDLPQERVAEELGVATGTASATLSQARGLLRAELQSGDSCD